MAFGSGFRSTDRAEPCKKRSHRCKAVELHIKHCKTVKNEIHRIRMVSQYFLKAEKGKVYAKAIEDIERILIEKSLEYCSGNKIKASRLLGINRNTMHAKAKRFKIDAKRFKP
ncbi:MAG: hypothetical protein A2Z72_09030 [Omnitrophica bacterium RBG_13_46_9]|nr:MAG: hypothetical protein A2Z72_09030 [Omnitrophica bacterium RBG_13_46_9]